MKLFLLICSLFFSVLSLSAQDRAFLPLNVADTEPTESFSIPIQADASFLSYFLRWEGTDTEWQIRFSENDRDWSDWQSLKRESHNPDLLISELQFIDADQRFFQVRQEQAGNQSLEVHFYDPGETRPGAVTNPSSSVPSEACPCPFPAVEERNDWCPSGNCPKISNPAITTVTHLIVHHSAGTNTSNDWAGVVRAIWNFHVNGNGWDDIGYNYLVDPNGVLYEGRGNNVRGAHFCGTNTGTMGVCVMGDFTNTTPTTEAIGGLVDLLSWKSCDRDISPLETAFHASSGLNLPRIAGHQDGCATECPGDQFYPLMPDVRMATFARIVTACSGLPGPLPLTASLLSTTEVHLNWTDNTEGESGFIMERKTIGGAAYSTVAQLIPDTEDYVDPVDLNEVYLYRIRAFTLTDTSAYSNETEVSTVMSAARDENAPWEFSLFPNPGQDNFQWQLRSELSGSVTLEIRNASGQVIQKRQMEPFGQMDTSQWPAGLYFLQIEQDGYQQQYKWVKRD